jgi:hypothetical protein
MAIATAIAAVVTIDFIVDAPIWGDWELTPITLVQDRLGRMSAALRAG